MFNNQVFNVGSHEEGLSHIGLDQLATNGREEKKYRFRDRL